MPVAPFGLRLLSFVNLFDGVDLAVLLAVVEVIDVAVLRTHVVVEVIEVVVKIFKGEALVSWVVGLDDEVKYFHGVGGLVKDKSDVG